jgi:protein-disulfide isomerase
MNKTNYWMISTIFLAGLMLGFGAGKLFPSSQTNLLAATESKNTVAEQSADSKQLAQKPPILPTRLYENVSKIKNANGNWTLGAKNAKVIIEEFSDFQCPYCHQYFANTYGQVFDNYIKSGKVSYVYYNYPLNFHPQAPKAAEAALCAGDQNKFWEMHDVLMENQSLWSGNNNAVQVYQNLASALKLNDAQFQECLNTNKYSKQVEKDIAAGESKGVSGTPTFLINGKKLVGSQPYETIKEMIEGEL